MRTDTRCRFHREGGCTSLSCSDTPPLSGDLADLSHLPRCVTTANVEPHAGHLIGTFGSFTFTLVRQGEAYGRSLCLTHDREDPLVEVYDARYRGKPGFTTAGQFISRYNLSTWRKHTGALSLYGAEPQWTLSAATFEAARVAIERFLNP